MTWSQVLSFPSVLQFNAHQSEMKRANQKSDIELILKVSKRVYRLGEPIEITSYLENVSDFKGYYVGNTDISLLGTIGLHDMELIIRDKKGSEVPIGRGAGTWFWGENMSVTDKLARAYVHIRPGMIHGLKQRIDFPFKPGRYRLVTTYHEHEALRWTEAERRALPIPVWTQQLVSNTVTITIMP